MLALFSDLERAVEGDLSLLLAAGVLAWPLTVVAMFVVNIAKHLRGESA